MTVDSYELEQLKRRIKSLESDIDTLQREVRDLEWQIKNDVSSVLSALDNHTRYHP